MHAKFALRHPLKEEIYAIILVTGMHLDLPSHKVANNCRDKRHSKRKKEEWEVY